MENENLDLVIMFADISGSTKIYELLGNTDAEHIIANSLNIISEYITEEGGTIIKTIGDEVMCRFDECNNALNASFRIHNELDQSLQEHRIEIAFRIGIHFGPTIVSKKDVFGDCVNVASRIATIARANQTIFSEDIYNRLDDSHKDDARQYDITSIKGKKEQMVVFEHVWEKGLDEGEAELTRIVGQVTNVDTNNTVSNDKRSLLITYINKKPVMLSAVENETISIGRALDSDLSVLSTMASRAHCSITYRRNKYILIDKSTNGTTVINGTTTPIFIKREEIPLIENGSIFFGKKMADSSDKDIIYFKLL